MFQGIASSRGTTIERAHAIAIHFLSLLTIALAELGTPQIRSEWLNGSLYNRVFNTRTIIDIQSLLTELAQEAAEFVKKTRVKKTNQIMQEVKAHIAKNLNNPELSLSSVSRHYHLNSSYFSRIFKQESGQSFTEYLLKLRMEEAVKLMNETDWKAYQIAERVGIKDPYYFSHCFKKVMKVSIQEYKKSIY